MSKKNIVLIVVSVAFVVLLCGAAILYTTLSVVVDEIKLVQQQEIPYYPDDEQVDESELAPDFSAVDEYGNEYALSDFRGTPVVMNFWASWCEPCRNEMPEFEMAYEAYGDEIQFLMVNMTSGSRESMYSASNYVESQGYTFPVLYDTKGEANIAYEVYSIPVTYFIDKQGRIVATAKGAIDGEILQQGIDMIYKESNFFDW